MVLIIPYLFPLMLGRTFDLNQMKTGVDIFPKSALKNTKLYNSPIYHSWMGLVERSDIARERAIGPTPTSLALALKIKAGILNAGAVGEYISDSFNRSNTVEVMIHGTFEQVTEYIDYDAELISSWKNYGETLGTHYVRSITYGGEVITSLRFKTNSTEVRDRVKGLLEWDLFKLENSERVQDILKSVESSEVKIFSSIPATKFPSDIGSLKSFIDGLLKDQLQYNEGRGLPIKMELWPLKKLDPTRNDTVDYGWNKWNKLSLPFGNFERKFDNLLLINKSVNKWINSIRKPLTKEQEQKLGNFCSKLDGILKLFYEVIGKLDWSLGPEQLKKAEDAYRPNWRTPSIHNEYLRLKQELDL